MSAYWVEAGLHSFTLAVFYTVHQYGVVTRLHEGKCGVQCGGDMVPGLLFANDMSLVASAQVKSLDILVKWCGAKINVSKLGIMHMRKKTVERCEVEYEIDGEVILWYPVTSI